MTTPRITVATPADRPAVVATVVAAFATDPAFRFFCPDDATYPAEAAVIAGQLFDERARRGSVWVADGGAAVAMWDAPDTPPSVHDAVGRFAIYEDTVAAAMPDGPRWYLGVLASRPEVRGRRLARATMAPGLAAAAEAGLPAILETSNPANLDVYRSVGFDVAHHLTVRDGDTELPVWILRRP